MKSRVSVAMTAYNGEKYIKRQLDSILMQLSECDEIIISYNQSTDDTWNIIKGYEKKYYPLVKVFPCPKMGLRANGENARKHCNGRYIFIADQDDCWLEGKVDAVVEAFEKTGAPVVLHDMRYADADLIPTDRTLFKERHSKPGLIRNLIRNSYHGGCMAINAEYYHLMEDRPDGIGFGDMWMGLVGEMCGCPVFINKEYMLFRCHNNNLSSRKRRPILQVLPERLRLIWHLIQRWPAVIKYRLTAR